MVGVVADIKATLRFVRGEVHGNSGSNDVGAFADKLLADETAFADLASGIVARLTQHGRVLIKHLNTIVAPIADINLAIISDLHAMHWVPEERRFSVPFGCSRRSMPQ